MDKLNTLLSEARSFLFSAEFLIGTVFGVFLTFLRRWIIRPSLMISGGSSGGSDKTGGNSYRSASLRITNHTRFMGFPVPNRETLRIQSATFYDPQLKRSFGHMQWKGGEENVSKVDIPVGESREVWVYGSLNGRVHFYVGNDVEKIKVSETMVELNKDRFFEIRITDIFGRKYSIPCKISARERRNSNHGADIIFTPKRSMRQRIDQVKYGIESVVSAFTMPRYHK